MSTFGDITKRMQCIIGADGEQFEHDHGRRAREDEGLESLKASLQLAIDLEFSTIPPYLMALWSIKDDQDPAAASIREVAQEEMLHMALACNMLTGIGGCPQISTVPPTYPTKLPGGLHKTLSVDLEGLNDESLITFMTIELPHRLFELDDRDDWDANRLTRIPRATDNNTTIGEFYECVAETFEFLKPDLNQDYQVTGPLAWSNIGDVRSVKWAIKVISHQGEGSTETPFEHDNDTTDLAHFYRFEELFMEAKLVWMEVNDDKVKGKFRKGEERKLPDAWPVGKVPKGGYLDKHLKGLKPATKKDVQYHLRRFDEVYTRLLNELQATWSGGGQRTLIAAYQTMFELETFARPLMEIEIPGGDGKTYGPCFRYLEGEE